VLIAVGLASGLGNCILMLPVTKALKILGHEIAFYVEDDNHSAELWKRCAYADHVVEAPADLNGYKLICGLWRPASWHGIAGISRYQCIYPYLASEAETNMNLARDLGWTGDMPDVSDWCRDLDRTPRWDVGIVPGCKGGFWLRKRHPGMAAVAAHFLAQGRRVAVFGRPSDDVEAIPGEHVETPRIEDLPDALAGCRIIIGTDSGVTHLANSLGMPTVIVHTASSAMKATPVSKPFRQVYRDDLPCRPCQGTAAWQSCREWRCRQINPVRVIEAAEAFLENS
jgi:ADP-heptose:LPS heptosyltransferase